MLAKILIIEDDVNGAELARFQLEQAGYDVRIAVDGGDGLRQTYAWRPDLILLDVLMPAISGWKVCERLREVTDVPIIFLTALDHEKHIVHGLKLGADDYVVKPYNPPELLARVEALLRRRRMDASSPSGVYVYNDLQIDFDQRRVTRGDTIIELTPLEFKLLACLAEKPGGILSHQYLRRRVWGGGHQSRGSLKLYIWYLRQKLESDPAHPQIILTERGVGYSLSRPPGQPPVGQGAETRRE
jgi:two-component system response regulator MtrA